MSRRIANIISEPEHLVTKLINELEDKNGYPSHDARHLAENVQKTRLKIKDLGLDPSDTTAKELYQALGGRFGDDSAKFEAYFNVQDASLQQKCSMATKLVTENCQLPQQWALKSKAAKLALKANPPRKLMKYLGYRSADSMLKRENVCELFLAAHETEPKSWQKNLSKYVSKLNHTEFETRPVKLLTLDWDKWGGIDSHNYATYESSVGVAGLWPSQDLYDASLLALVLMLTESFTPKTQLKPGPMAVRMNVALWWTDMDHLVAELDGQHVSLNIKDCAFNHWLGNDFEHRVVEQGAKNFWHELVNRYVNRPAIEAPFEEAPIDSVNVLQSSIPQPAYEFAEDFDG